HDEQGQKDDEIHEGNCLSLGLAVTARRRQAKRLVRDQCAIVPGAAECTHLRSRPVRRNPSPPAGMAGDPVANSIDV
ncbi:hypothetical protein ABQF26_28135, partial [Mycolicibacterium elephantis]